MGVLGFVVQSNFRECCADFSGYFAGFCTLDIKRQRNIFKNGTIEQQMMILKDKSNLSTERRNFSASNLFERLAIHDNFATGCKLYRHDEF